MLVIGAFYVHVHSLGSPRAHSSAAESGRQAQYLSDSKLRPGPAWSPVVCSDNHFLHELWRYFLAVREVVTSCRTLMDL